ncbi:MAG: murein biosynthesis integral membrane protein MurJ [Candidatus Saccharibacteria bacterium]
MNPSAVTPKKKHASIGSVAFLLVATSLLGQVLGFLRTKLVNANFPPIGPHSTDAYFAAFNIPDFFFFTLSAGALGVALMPVLSDRLHKGDRRAVWELATSLLNFLAIIMSGVALIILIFARPLITYVVAPHMPPEQIDIAVNIMRLLAFNPLLFTISGIITSVQQTMGRFFVYAMAPLVYNLSIIISIFVFKHNIGLVGLGIGALIGAILQLLVVMLGVSKLNFHWHPHIMWRSSDFRTVLRNLPPRSLDQGVDQIGDIVDTHIASGLGAGSITYYNNAYILSTAPILLIGTAISTAAFPRLNARLSQGRPDLFRRDFLQILRVLIWLSMPVVVIAFFTRGYLSRLIYTSGNEQIAIIFGFMTLAIFARILYTLLSRWFYSQKDTRTPLVISLFTIAFNVILSVALTRPGGYGVAGLALAQSIVASAEVIVLFSIMLIRDPKLFDPAFLSGLWRIISVTGFSILAAFIMVSFYPLGASDRGIFTLGSKLALISLVVFGVHIAVSALFSLEEVNPIFARARKLFYKPLDVDL